MKQIGFQKPIVYMKTKTYSFSIKESRAKIPVRILIPKVHKKLFFEALSEFGDSKAKLLEHLVERFQNGKNLGKERIRYKEFREKGYFIGSGAIESANSYSIQNRLKRSRMKWKVKNANGLAHLRNIYYSDQWDKTWSKAWSKAA